MLFKNIKNTIQALFVLWMLHAALYSEYGNYWDNGSPERPKTDISFYEGENPVYLNTSPLTVAKERRQSEYARKSVTSPVRQFSSWWIGFLLLLVLGAAVYLFVGWDYVDDVEIPKEADEKIDHTENMGIPVKRRFEVMNGVRTYVTTIVNQKNVASLVEGRSTVLSKEDKKQVVIEMGLKDSSKIRWEAVKDIKGYWAVGDSFATIERKIKNNPQTYKKTSIKKICKAFRMALEM